MCIGHRKHLWHGGSPCIGKLMPGLTIYALPIGTALARFGIPCVGHGKPLTRLGILCIGRGEPLAGLGILCIDHLAGLGILCIGHREHLAGLRSPHMAKGRPWQSWESCALGRASPLQG